MGLVALMETAVQRAIHEDVDDIQSLVLSPHTENKNL